MKLPVKRYLIVQVSVALIYHGTMHLALFAPVQLPRTALDQAIPYNDLFGGIYLSFFLLIFYSICLTSALVSAACAKAVLVAALGCGALFVFYPTVYTGAVAPAQPSFLYHVIKDYDQQYNCFPSMHVAISFVCCYYSSLQKTRFTKLLFLAWFLLLCASVFITQQHHFYDVLGGLLMGIAAVYATVWWLCKPVYSK